MKLELGCGELPQEGYDIHYDLRPLPHVEACGDALALPFRGDSFGEIFNQHLLEHFPRSQTIMVLREWLRVLRPRGVLKILCPNLIWLVECFRENFKDRDARRNVIRWLYGGQEEDWNYHKTAFDFFTLSEDMTTAGFVNIQPQEGHNIGEFGLWIQGEKPSNIITLGGIK